MDRLARYIRDPGILNLLGQYLRRTAERGGWFWEVEGGISLGCPLSPLIGAFFLYELDTRLGHPEVDGRVSARNQRVSQTRAFAAEERCVKNSDQ